MSKYFLQYFIPELQQPHEVIDYVKMEDTFSIHSQIFSIHIYQLT